MLVYHHRRKLFGAHLKQVWSYAVHRGYFVKKFPKTSLRLSYFLPSLLVLGLLGGILVSFFNPVLRTAFVLALGLYFLAALVTSLPSGIRMGPLVFLGIVSTHITYGAGFIRGMFAGSLVR